MAKTVTKRAREKVHAMIDKFLDEGRSESKQGSYAYVRDGDTDKLHDIIDSIVDAKYERDPDGDVPINVRIIDRTRYESEHWHEVPGVWSADGLTGDARSDAVEQRLSCLTSNVLIAADRLGREYKSREFDRARRASESK